MSDAKPADGAGVIGAEELFRAHAPFVARFLYRLGVRPDAIEDALQEVFLVVHRQGGYRPGAAKPTSYLGSLALHAATADRRRERARRARESDAPVDRVASSQSGPVELLEANDSLRLLQAALDRLEPDYRTTLILAEIEGESCQSIAAAMSVPVGTVYWRLHTARKKFQQALTLLDAQSRTGREIAVQSPRFAGERGGNREKSAMLLLGMMSSSWPSSEARELLQLGAGRSPVRYALEEGLRAHRELAASTAPLPSWAGAATPSAHFAIYAVLAATAIAGTGAWMLWTPGHSASSFPALANPVTVLATANPATAQATPLVTTPAEPVMAPAGSQVAGSPTAVVPTLPVESLPVASARGPTALAARSTAASVPRAAVESPAVDAKEVPRPVPDAVSGSSLPDEREMRETAIAERLLATDPARALARIRSANALFADGYLQEERSYVEIMALLGTAAVGEARPKVEHFLAAYPDGAFTRRVREAWRAAILEQ
jgi:RNA polymerase sigma-70 factor (ECF subfamily)